MAPLFRVEVLQHRQRDWLGSIQLNRPVSLTLLTGGVASVLLAVAMFLSFAEYTRRVRLAGWLVDDPVRAGVMAQLLAPASTVAYLRVGQSVRIRYPSFPEQHVAHASGRVIHVGGSPVLPEELQGTALRTAAGRNGLEFYRIAVRLDRESLRASGRVEPLVAGVQLDAEVALERRRLVEWLFEPALGAFHAN